MLPGWEALRGVRNGGRCSDVLRARGSGAHERLAGIPVPTHPEERVPGRPHEPAPARALRSAGSGRRAASRWSGRRRVVRRVGSHHRRMAPQFLRRSRVMGSAGILIVFSVLGAVICCEARVASGADLLVDRAHPVRRDACRIRPALGGGGLPFGPGRDDPPPLTDTEPAETRVSMTAHGAGMQAQAARSVAAGLRVWARGHDARIQGRRRAADQP